jgi:hypothetical protein
VSKDNTSAILASLRSRASGSHVRHCNVSFGVNRVILILRRLLPVIPDKRTISEPVGMSQACQNRTHAPQQTACTSCNIIQSPRRLALIGDLTAKPRTYCTVFRAGLRTSRPSISKCIFLYFVRRAAHAGLLSKCSSYELAPCAGSVERPSRLPCLSTADQPRYLVLH